MLKLLNHNIILPKYLEIVKKKGSSLIFSVQGGWGKEKNCKPAEKIAAGNEGEAEEGWGEPTKNGKEIFGFCIRESASVSEAQRAEATSFNFAECKTWRRRWDSPATQNFPSKILVWAPPRYFASLLNIAPSFESPPVKQFAKQNDKSHQFCKCGGGGIRTHGRLLRPSRISNPFV